MPFHPRSNPYNNGKNISKNKKLKKRGHRKIMYLYRSQKCNAISPTAPPLTITLAPESATALMSSSTLASSVLA